MKVFIGLAYEQCQSATQHDYIWAGSTKEGVEQDIIEFAKDAKEMESRNRDEIETYEDACDFLSAAYGFKVQLVEERV